MIVRMLRRYGYGLLVIGLLGFILVAGAFVVIVALPDLQGSAALPPAAASPTPPTGDVTGMTWLTLPDNADCSACHLTDQGAIGVRNVPALAHPLSGWTNCTACHDNDRLVQTAPGHTGIHASDCLLCHKAASTDMPAPLSRPHRESQNQACLSCHGSSAPLPTDMSHRTQAVCWLCHVLPQIEPPLPTHSVTVGEKDCLTCHVAGNAGALPDDHSSRTDAECLLCHEPRDMAPDIQPLPSPLPSSAVSYLPPVPITTTGWWATIR